MKHHKLDFGEQRPKETQMQELSNENVPYEQHKCFAETSDVIFQVSLSPPSEDTSKAGINMSPLF